MPAVNAMFVDFGMFVFAIIVAAMPPVGTADTTGVHTIINKMPTTNDANISANFRARS